MLFRCILMIPYYGKTYFVSPSSSLSDVFNAVNSRVVGSQTKRLVLGNKLATFKGTIL